MEFTLLFAALIAVAVLYAFVYWEGRRGNAADCTRNLWDLAIVSTVVGLFGGRLAAMVMSGVNPITNPGDIIFVRAGIATGPAALLALVTLAVLSRSEVIVVADGLAAAVLGALAGWHAGCLARDACLGTPSDFPWAYALKGSVVTRHPVELYAALLFLAAGAAIAWMKAYRRPTPLVPAGLALLTSGATRLLTESMRPALSGGPEPWYWIAVLAGGVFVGYARVTARRQAAEA